MRHIRSVVMIFSLYAVHFLESASGDDAATPDAPIQEERAVPPDPDGDVLPPSGASPGENAPDVLAQLSELRALVDRLRTSYTGLESSVVDLERRAVTHKSSTSLLLLMILLWYLAL